MNKPFPLNPEAIQQGLTWAQNWTDGPVLCIVTAESIRFAVVNERRFIASWERFEATGAPYRFFLIPPFIASTLSNRMVANITDLRAEIDQAEITFVITDTHGEYTLQWRWTAGSFQAPPFFDHMVRTPTETLARETFISVADAIHLAVANLGRFQALDNIAPQDLAILVDFAPGHFRINGQPLAEASARQYYFDPRLIMRGLEVVRGKHISFSVSSTPDRGRAILYMMSRRDNWHIQCAILSIVPGDNTHIIRQQLRIVRENR